MKGGGGSIKKRDQFAKKENPYVKKWELSPRPGIAPARKGISPAGKV